MEPEKKPQTVQNPQFGDLMIYGTSKQPLMGAHVIPFNNTIERMVLSIMNKAKKLAKESKKDLFAVINQELDNNKKFISDVMNNYIAQQTKNGNKFSDFPELANNTEFENNQKIKEIKQKSSDVEKAIKQIRGKAKKSNMKEEDLAKLYYEQLIKDQNFMSKNINDRDTGGIISYVNATFQEKEHKTHDQVLKDILIINNFIDTFIAKQKEIIDQNGNVTIFDNTNKNIFSNITQEIKNTGGNPSRNQIALCSYQAIDDINNLIIGNQNYISKAEKLYDNLQLDISMDEFLLLLSCNIIMEKNGRNIPYKNIGTIDIDHGKIITNDNKMLDNISTNATKYRENLHSASKIVRDIVIDGDNNVTISRLNQRPQDLYAVLKDFTEQNKAGYKIPVFARFLTPTWNNRNVINNAELKLVESLNGSKAPNSEVNSVKSGGNNLGGSIGQFSKEEELMKFNNNIERPSTPTNKKTDPYKKPYNSDEKPKVTNFTELLNNKNDPEKGNGPDFS